MTRNNADFHGITVSHEDNGDGELLITANHPKHGEVGRMVLAPAYGHRHAGREILDVEVPEEHQRKGVATAMWNYALMQGFNPEHSEERSDPGDAWAKSVGGVLPPRRNWYDN